MTKISLSLSPAPFQILLRRLARLCLGFRRRNLRICLGGLCIALRRLHAARVAPGIDGALVGDVAERSLVGPLGFLFPLHLAPGLVLVLFPITLHGLLLSPGWYSQHRDDCRGNERSHAHVSSRLMW